MARPANTCARTRTDDHNRQMAKDPAMRTAKRIGFTEDRGNSSHCSIHILIFPFGKNISCTETFLEAGKRTTTQLREREAPLLRIMCVCCESPQHTHCGINPIKLFCFFKYCSLLMSPRVDLNSTLFVLFFKVHTSNEDFFVWSSESPM